MKYLLIIISLFSFSILNAQLAHNRSKSNSNCKLLGEKRCRMAEGCSDCPACRAEENKKKLAKSNEDKKTEDARYAANEEKKKTDFAALKKQQQQAAAKAKEGEVLINGNPNNLIVKSKEQPKDAVTKNTVNKNLMYTLLIGIGWNWVTDYADHNYYSNYFLNENNDTILRNDDFLITYHALDRDNKGNWVNKDNFPKNVGIVTFKETKTIRSKEYYVTDLIDLKGKRHFNDKSITYIAHIADNYFLILKDYYNHGYQEGYVTSGGAEIYDLKTKESIVLKRGDIGAFNDRLFLASDQKYVKSEDERPTSSFKSCISTRYGVHNYQAFYVNNDGSVELKESNY